MQRLKRCLELFLVFFRIGLFTFGGGYAMISLIEDEVGERRRWLGADELSEVFAIAESTPGPIAVNCATYVGYRQAGVWGSICATLGVVLPSFLIILVISHYIERFMHLTAVAHAFRGIQAAVAFLILRAGIRLSKKLPRKPWAAAACAAAGLMVMAINLMGLRISTIWLILLGAALGLLLPHSAKGGDGK